MFPLEIYKKIADHFVGEMPLMKYCQIILGYTRWIFDNM